MAQGLALWRSLARHDPAAGLWVLALDDETTEVLRKLQDVRLKVVALAELLAADPDLAAVQAGRPRAEFIFTLTPCLLRHLLDAHPEIDLLTYLDADLYFFSDPAPIPRELGRGSVLVAAHRYPPWQDDAARYGRFNVGVLVFRADPRARACLDWWRARCLETCALTVDGTHYGDQKYLDEWPPRFAGVVELKHPGVNVAPWNWAGSRFELHGGVVGVDGCPLIVFHFAQFRRVSEHWFDSGQLEYGIMPLRLRSRIYGEYWTALVAAETAIRAVQPGYVISRRGWTASLGPWHLAMLRLFWGQFWLRLGPWWLAGRLGLGQLSGRMMGLYRRWQRRGA